MLKTIKAMAIGFLIAVAAVAAIVFGAFIGTLLLFLGGVFVVGVMLWVIWMSWREYHNKNT